MIIVFASHTKHRWSWNDLNFFFNQTGRSLRSGRFASNLVNLIVQVKCSCHGSKSLMRTRGRKSVLWERILRAVLEIKISTSVHKLLKILKLAVFLGFTCLCLLECLQFLEFVTVEQSLRLTWHCVQLWSDFSVAGMPAIYHLKVRVEIRLGGDEEFSSDANEISLRSISWKDYTIFLWRAQCSRVHEGQWLLRWLSKVKDTCSQFIGRNCEHLTRSVVLHCQHKNAERNVNSTYRCRYILKLISNSVNEG